MNIPRQRCAGARAGGFSVLELAVAVTVIGILTFILLRRVVFYQEQAERVAAEQVVDTLRSALRLQVAHLVLNGSEHDVAGLADQNPMDWLEKKPANYRGEFYSPGANLLVPGTWYFDRTDRKLTYLFHHPELISNNAQKQLNFQVKLVTIEFSAARHASEVRLAEGVTLDQVVR